MDETRASSPRDFSVQIALEGRGSFSASGPDDLVFRALENFFAQLATAIPARLPRLAPQVEVEEEVPASETGSAKSAIGPLGPFHDKKKPKNNAEAIAVFTVWAKRTDGTTTFTPDSILALWRRTSRKTPGGNLNRDIGNAVKAGWLDPAGKGHYTVGGHGEQFVDKLPERGK